MKCRIACVAIVAVAVAAVEVLAGGGQPVRVIEHENVFGPKPESLALDEIEIKVGITGVIMSDHNPAKGGEQHIALKLPPMPVWGFLAPGGSLKREDLVSLNRFGPPTDIETELALKPGEYDPQRGDLILLFWSETESVATPWAEVYQQTDGQYKVRSLPPTVPSDLVMTVPGRHDTPPKNPVKETPPNAPGKGSGT